MIDLTGRDQSWWPDLTGRTVAIFASGPSITREQCNAVRDLGWYAIAINETWRLASWADVLYGCDWQWWAECAPQREAFVGTRIVGYLPATVRGRPREMPKGLSWQSKLLNFVPVRVGCTGFLFDGLEVGSGNNSAHQITNWAVRCGATNIGLFGVDCHSPNRHWHGEHKFRMATQQKESTMVSWRRNWEEAKAQMDERGVTVTNYSPGTALKCFPKGRIEDVMERAA